MKKEKAGVVLNHLDSLQRCHLSHWQEVVTSRRGSGVRPHRPAALAADCRDMWPLSDKAAAATADVDAVH